MKNFVFLLMLWMLPGQSAFSIPGPIQFLVDESGDTLGIVLGTDTFALLSIPQVRVANGMKVSLDQCREEKDTLQSINSTLTKLNKKNDGIILFLEGENSLLIQAGEQDSKVITGLEKAVANERKKATPWKIATGFLVILGAIKYL